YEDSATHPNPNHTVTATLDAFVGSKLDLWQNFNASLDATVLSAGSKIGTLDIGHTVHVYLSGPTGISFLGSNGATFQPAAVETVPEPASGMMFGMGLFGVAGFLRSRRRATA